MFTTGTLPGAEISPKQAQTTQASVFYHTYAANLLVYCSFSHTTRSTTNKCLPSLSLFRTRPKLTKILPTHKNLNENELGRGESAWPTSPRSSLLSFELASSGVESFRRLARIDFFPLSARINLHTYVKVVSYLGWERSNSTITTRRTRSTPSAYA